jgi:hypothetical protein
VKQSLVTTSELKHLLQGFVKFEARAQSKMVQAVLDGKLAPSSPDPMVTDCLKQLTTYAGDLLRDQCALSLYYTCKEVECEGGGKKFHVSHKDHEEKHQVVLLGEDGNFTCSCRKVVWHGLVCRHILTALRSRNAIGCPMTYFNKRWLSESRVDLNGPPNPSPNPNPNPSPSPRDEEAERLSSLRKAHRAVEDNAAGSSNLFNIALNRSKETLGIIKLAHGESIIL